MNGELTDFGSGGDYPEPTYVVGIGASAGGLEALERFFHSMPADTGMAFVVVQHLSPDFVSVMDELLVRQTDLPVFTVQNGMHVRPNAVYLIPPKKEMIISEGKLLLTDKDPKQGLTLPIDIFFRSLAQDLGPRAIGIVLSGTGSDGSRGIRHIHEMGGLVIVQNEETAKFDGMPRSALATGVVDLVVSPDQMADSLAKYAAHPIARDLAAAARPVPVDETGMNKVLRLLRVAYGIDFSLYKPTTVLRRIERRLMLSQLLNFDQYVEQLSSDTAELNALYRDLLIGVTQFFRDKEAFGIVESLVLPELLARLGGSEEARIWVAGCATGEEAYSLAIVIHEQLARLHRPLNVKIFATDVHQASLDVASLGVYAESSLADVSLERLKRYFLRKGEQWQVVPELRQMIVFAPHNIIKDAPFTRLDLVSCRNLLIYFQPAAQKKAISLFHFGLKPNGVLLLGPSEGLGELEDEFTAVDRQWKVYRKRRDVRLLTDLRLPSVGVAPGTGDRQRGSGGSQSADPDLVTAYDQLLSSYVPPAVLIDRKRQIVHVFGSAADYLQFKPGRTSSDVVELIREELRTPLSGAIQRVSKELTPVQFLGVCSRSDAETREVRMSVRPLLNRTSELTHLLVLLEETPPVIRSDVPGESPAGIELGEVNYARIESLESELRHSQESLHAAVEELETSNEELQATNEELVASNEELQSTNEELHSVNEELYTVNAEYQRKITELTELTDDMENLLVSTGVGVLFLDRDLGIRKFTPAIAGSFHIVAQDVGRPFDSFTHNIEHPGLIDDVRAVLASGETFEKEVRDRFGHWYLLRILPYQTRQRSGQNRPADVDDPEGAPRELRSSPPAVEGVVVTLIDIGSLKETQEALREKDRQLRGILDNSPAFVFIKDLQGRYLMANRQSRRVLRAAADKVLGKTDYDFLPRPVADRLAAQDRAVANTGETHETEETIRQNGRPRVYLSTKYPLRDELGRPLAIAGICTDISRQKRAERRARLAVEYRDRFLAMLSHELRNPLAAVQNATQLLERLARIQDGVPERERLAAGDADDVRRVSEVLRRQSDQMARLLDDLLDISRVTRGKIELRKEVVDLRTISQDALVAVRSNAAVHELKLRVSLPDSPLYVHVDAARIQQVQVNLLVNAVKYTPAGGEIEFHLQRSDNKALIRIRDTGVGMSREFQRRLFEPFVQADETLNRSDGGMGVGLTLVRALVELHGGSVHAYSEGPGKGSEFCVELPLSLRSHSEAPADEVRPAEGQPSQNVSLPAGLKLLIVEDNRDARDMLTRLLQSYGCAVTTAADGFSALTAIEHNPPEVAFLDIGLPEMNGYEVARRVRRKFGNDTVYLVALTGYGQPADRRKSRAAGFDEHLTKPVNIAELFRVILHAHAARNPPGPAPSP